MAHPKWVIRREFNKGLLSKVWRDLLTTPGCLQYLDICIVTGTQKGGGAGRGRERTLWRALPDGNLILT